MEKADAEAVALVNALTIMVNEVREPVLMLVLDGLAAENEAFRNALLQVARKLEGGE